MAQIMSAHSSFVYLVENIPHWQREVNTLAYRAHVKNTEFVAEYARLVNQIRPKRKKTPSLASINNGDEKANARPESVSSSSSSLDRVEIDPFEAGNKYLYAQARRKRKPGSVIRSAASGPQKFRNKNQVVVYYDGFMQEHLDALVRLVGNGRNNLRKGKNSLVAARGFQLPRLTRALVRDFSTMDDSKSRSTSALPGKQKTESSSEQEATNHETTFLQVDKELESIQSLCEVAAHQFLRDGDCQTEMDTLKQKLKDLHVRVKSTAEVLSKFEATQQSQSEALDLSFSDFPRGSESDATLSTRPSLDVLHTPKLGAGSLPGMSHSLGHKLSRPGFFSAPDIVSHEEPPLLVADDIEVDDDSDPEDFLVDVTSFRMARTRA
ncbi:hypothetical protein B0A52_02011 [Exophiala mesophila]|uniref:Uncharacterized protein n=1 Tax=Exophiala mesophila TaxID=212818 RepID=A0A438NEL5_EXOME|nr:hypothetical protein B0A52_02011 [Exophiala mesophila]